MDSLVIIGHNNIDDTVNAGRRNFRRKRIPRKCAVNIESSTRQTHGELTVVEIKRSGNDLPVLTLYRDLPREEAARRRERQHALIKHFNRERELPFTGAKHIV